MGNEPRVLSKETRWGDLVPLVTIDPGSVIYFNIPLLAIDEGLNGITGMAAA